MWFSFAWELAMPVTVFAYCYGRIFYLIRRHNKEVDPSQGVTMAVMPPVQSTDQIQQQATEGKAGTLTRTELNVLQTMIAVIICFVVCWTPVSVAVVVETIRVCQILHIRQKVYRSYCFLSVFNVIIINYS